MPGAGIDDFQLHLLLLWEHFKRIMYVHFVSGVDLVMRLVYVPNVPAGCLGDNKTVACPPPPHEVPFLLKGGQRTLMGPLVPWATALVFAPVRGVNTSISRDMHDALMHL